MIIEFEENDIQEEKIIDVYQEVLDENAQIMFNKVQVKSCISQLIGYKQKKIEMFYDLVYPKSVISQLVYIKTIVPLVQFNTIEYFGEKMDQQDVDVDNNYFMTSQDFSKYITKFNEVNRGKKIDSKTAENTLYILSRNYAKHKNHFDKEEVFNKNTSVLQYKLGVNPDEQKNMMQQLRLIGSIRNVYKGDSIDVVGYYNLIDDTKNTRVFEFETYFQHILELNIGDKVELLFNDFGIVKYEKKVKSLVTDLKGIIKSIRGNKIVIEGVETDNKFDNLTYYTDEYNPFYIFEESKYPTQNSKFCKRNLAISNIIFTIPSNYQNIKAFIHPISVS